MGRLGSVKATAAARAREAHPNRAPTESIATLSSCATLSRDLLECCRGLVEPAVRVDRTGANLHAGCACAVFLFLPGRAMGYRRSPSVFHPTPSPAEESVSGRRFGVVGSHAKPGQSLQIGVGSWENGRGG